jgi:N-acetylmuramoyl-L-alanine amidase
LKLKLKFLITLSIILFLPLSPLLGENIKIIEHNSKKYISMYDLTNTLNIQNSFDIITGRGKLFSKGVVAVYQIDLPVMLINNKLIKTKFPAIRKEGDVLFPLNFFEKIIDEFYPNYTHIEKQNVIYLTNKSAVDETPSRQTLKEKKEEKDKKTIQQPAADKITFLIIDPGHGGKDPGAIGKGGIKEKRITLKIAAYLEEYLKTKLKAIKIQSTRNSDKFLDLSKRTEIANKMLKKNENGLFVSIHVNASILHSIAGFETYFLSQNPSNEEARATAALENNVIILEENSKNKRYNDVEHVEAIMLTTQIQKESASLANFIQKYLDKKISESASKGVKKADFFVLRDSLMPAALVEVGYISNSKEIKKLIQSDYQKKIAQGIGEGIIQFIKDYNKNIKK